MSIVLPLRITSGFRYRNHQHDVDNHHIARTNQTLWARRGDISIRRIPEDEDGTGGQAGDIEGFIADKTEIFGPFMPVST